MLYIYSSGGVPILYLNLKYICAQFDPDMAPYHGLPVEDVIPPSTTSSWPMTFHDTTIDECIYLFLESEVFSQVCEPIDPQVVGSSPGANAKTPRSNLGRSLYVEGPRTRNKD